MRDPLNDALIRYWDGSRWTFHTAVLPTGPEPNVNEDSSDAPALRHAASNDALRPDIAAARKRVKGGLLGAGKEIGLLGNYLRDEEQVVALAPATGKGIGVLACTNQRLLFLFSGLLQSEFKEVDWNQARHVVYNQPTKEFMVYNTAKLTKRSVPAFLVKVNDMTDAVEVANAAVAASAAPRLDII